MQNNEFGNDAPILMYARRWQEEETSVDSGEQLAVAGSFVQERLESSELFQIHRTEQSRHAY